MTSPGQAPEGQSLWRDKEKRRAALLSLVLHLGLLLLMSWWFLLPDSAPPETFLVIEVGTPELAEQATNASAAESPAPQASEPQVADSETGAPQAQEQEAETPTERPATVQEEASTPTETPVETPAQTVEAVAQEPAEPQVAQETPVAETEPVQPEPVAEAEPAELQETSAEPVAEVEPEAELAPEPTPEPEVAEVTPPTPAARVPEAAAPPDLPATDAPTSTTLPEIAEVKLEPQPLAQAVQIPLPQVEMQIPEARAITPTPNVEIAEARAVPQPQIEASVAAEQTIPQPQAQVAVTEARSLTVTPQVSVAEPQPLAVTPEVTVAEPRSLAVTPQVSVAEPRSLAVTPEVAVAEPRSLAVTPQVTVAEPRSLAVTPQVSVSEAVAVPIPTVTATVTAPEAEPVVGSAEGETLAASEAAAGEPAEEPAVAAGGAETVASAAESSLESTLPGGGNAAQAGQDRSDEAASLAGLGAAASPEGGAEPTGAPVTRAQQPYRETRERPLAVMMDNTDIGYPQTGLLQASAIYEMPVEGGLTRLMTVYDHVDPNRVGPVRSARDYFVELSQSLNGILVHDGGSPSAMALIQRSSTPTFNAYTEGGLFARGDSRNAPYNLYTTGSDLRQAVNRLNLGLTRTVSGEVFRPAVAAPAATQISVDYSGTYSSGFRYLPEVNLYRWQRNGEAATDASGEAVLVDAVVVANITARLIPNDPAGRLYIPLSGGEATLYLGGKAIPGSWTPQSGLSFVAGSGEVIDLTPFKHWVLYAPSWATVSAQ